MNEYRENSDQVSSMGNLMHLVLRTLFNMHYIVQGVIHRNTECMT
uniref:Uncharacterized protein n=1 Tax=Arundo donax TaxID=35708 RepID=A0A0A9S9A1_ARUDO